MNILILCTHLNPGGISRYAINLAEGLVQNGNSVWVGCWGGAWTEELERKKIGFLRLPINTKSIVSPKVIFSLYVLSKFVGREKIQIVHGNTRVTQLLAYLIHKMYHIPYVSTFHGFYRSTFMRRAFGLSGLRTIAVSHSVKEHVEKDLRIEASKIRVVHNGIDIHTDSKGVFSREQYGFKKDEFIIGILGRVSEEKGHLLSAQAFSLLLKQAPSVRFLISGKGKLEKKLKEYFDTHDMNDKVSFLDLPSHQFLKVVDILLVPSRKEGFGFSIIEAFLAGVPVIGFNTGGIAEIIRDGENGLLFYEYNANSLKNAIERMMHDQRLRHMIVDQARSDVLRFSLEQMVRGTQNVYQEVVQ